MLVATGYTAISEFAPTEIIDIDDPSVSCQSPDFFPLRKNVHAVSGLLLDSVPMVCGGYDYDIFDAEDRCLVLEPSGQWTVVGEMLEPRQQAASILWNADTLLVSGGFDNSGYKSSSQLITLTESNDEETSKYSISSRRAPSLPEIVSSHCLIKLNESTAFVVGGNERKRETFFLDLNIDLDHEVFDYAPGPELSIGRAAHVCGTLVNPGDGSDAIVVTTGGFNFGGLVSTEMWIVGSDRWISGPDLPIGMGLSAGLTSSDGKSFYVVGGWNGEHQGGIYKLSFQDGYWRWTTLDQKLEHAREQHIAMLIPDSLTNCTQISA